MQSRLLLLNKPVDELVELYKQGHRVEPQVELSQLSKQFLESGKIGIANLSNYNNNNYNNKAQIQNLGTVSDAGKTIIIVAGVLILVWLLLYGKYRFESSAARRAGVKYIATSD